MVRKQNLKHKQRNNYIRNIGTRNPIDRVLIVTEGSKTEPNYFKEIRSLNRLTTISVKIIASKHTAPIQIAQYAVQQFNEKQQEFDRIYIVFDRDNHNSYCQAIDYTKKQKLYNDEQRKVIFEAIVSIPNFELWFLLHYILPKGYISGNEVLKKLRKYIIHYTKGGKGHFAKLKPKLINAFKNAKKLKDNHDFYYGYNPYTKVDELVNFLIQECCF